MFDANYMLIDNGGTAVTADANGTAFDVLWMPHTPVVFGLYVGGTISGTSPTLDVKIQGTNDNGSNWSDIVSFTQVTTTGGRQYVRALTPYKQIRGVIDVGGTSPSYGTVLLGVVPTGEFTPAEPK